MSYKAGWDRQTDRLTAMYPPMGMAAQNCPKDIAQKFK